MAAFQQWPLVKVEFCMTVPQAEIRLLSMAVHSACTPRYRAANIEIINNATLGN